jgi:uncharacterized iron-regulated protein
MPAEPVLPDGIYRVLDGARLTPQELLDEVAAVAGEGPLVIYVGETHDNAVHHLVQATLLEGLLRRFPGRVALGMEMFPVHTQSILDAYSRREIGDEVLRVRTEWDEIWGFDFEFYAPMLHLARLQGSSIIALNAPRALTRALATVGVEGLSHADRSSLPDTFGLDNPEHRLRMRAVFDAVHEMDEATFERFYAAQVAWDSTMAASVSRYMDKHPDVRAIMVVAGTYHVSGGMGIPWHLTRGRDKDVRRAIIVPLDADEVSLTASGLAEMNGGSYVWLSRDPKAGSRR